MARASFYDCDPASRVTNEVALGESHALAAKYGFPDAAAVICQTIAACASAESGYAVFTYGLSYGHYTEKGLEGRQWGPDRAEGLEPYKHALARTALASRVDIEAVYTRCFPRKMSELSDAEREDGAVRFRQEMQARFGSPDAEPGAAADGGA